MVARICTWDLSANLIYIALGQMTSKYIYSTNIHVRTGYVPGELIGFQAEMDNKSSREMKGTKLELLEHVRYMTPERSKTESRVVAQINRGSMGPGESDTWQGKI